MDNRFCRVSCNPQSLNQHEITFHRTVVNTTSHILKHRHQRWHTNTIIQTSASTSISTEPILSHTSITTLLSQITQNAFTLATRNVPSIGLGIHPSAAIVNHSCQPSLVQKFLLGHTNTPPRLLLTLGTDVKEEVELFIAYRDVLRPRGGERKNFGRGITSGAGACAALPLG